MSTGLASITEAKRLLAASTDLSEIADIKNKAEAVRLYLKASGESLEAQNRAAEVRLRAERRAGELLAGMDKHCGGRPAKTGSTMEPVSLADLGIDKKQSHRWQLAAKVPEEQFVDLVRSCVENGKELTSASVLKLARDMTREDLRRATVDTLANEPIDDAVDRLTDIVRLVCEWWPSDHTPTLPDALRTLADSIEQGGFAE